MTMMEKMHNESNGENEKKQTQHIDENEKNDEPHLTDVESQFKNIMAEFSANAGFSTTQISEPPVDTMIEILSSKDVMVSLTLLLSYIRYCVNHGVKKDITLKIGYNKPPNVPMNFAINEEMLEEIYPGDTIEIN